MVNTSPLADVKRPPRTESTPSIEQAWRVLSGVMDPEVPVVSVVDLGIVRDVSWNEADADAEPPRLTVTLTPTYSGCPATEVIEHSVREALLTAGFATVTTRLQRAPAWTTDWISEHGRRQLREYGIAPSCKVDVAAGVPIRLVSRRPAPAIECPRCASRDTERLSAFGATACKALYRCRACREPFEYFKPL